MHVLPCDSFLFLYFDDWRWKMIVGKRELAVKVKVKVKGGCDVPE
jgi:hypothetical protein